MKIDFEKGNGLVPVIIQDADSLSVLMLGYMNEEAFEKSQKEGRVTFYSRSKERLWTKGETSGNYLIIKNISVDCDNDTLLIKAKALGPTCHTGSYSCFQEEESQGFLGKLEAVIEERLNSKDDSSYTKKLMAKGINKVAQKVGEEAVELVIEAKDDNEDLFKNEAADLLYHFLVLLKAKNLKLEDIERVLFERSR